MIHLANVFIYVEMFECLYLLFYLEMKEHRKK